MPTDFSFDLEVKVKSESKGTVNANVKTDQKTSEGFCLRSLAVEMCRNYIIAQEQRENVNKTPTTVLANTYKHSWAQTEVNLPLSCECYSGRFEIMSRSIYLHTHTHIGTNT